MALAFINAESCNLRKRVELGIEGPSLEVPDLKNIQLVSFDNFFNKENIEKCLKTIFPISNSTGTLKLEYVSYTIVPSKFTVNECLVRGLTYSASLRAKLRLTVSEKNSDDKLVLKDIREQSVYLGEVPVLTDTGSFVINGTQRVVVSQLHRSPGVFYEMDSKTYANNIIFNATVIPKRGSWLELDLDNKGVINGRIDRRKKFPITTLFRALGYNTSQILDKFYSKFNVEVIGDHVKLNISASNLRGETFAFPILSESKEEIIPENTRVNSKHIKTIENLGLETFLVPVDYLLDKVLAEDLEIEDQVFLANTLITNENLEQILSSKQKTLSLIEINSISTGPYISDTLRVDDNNSLEAAITAIYQMMRPGEPANIETAKNLFKSLFFTPEKYDLSDVGRMKINFRLGNMVEEGCTHLTEEDVFSIVSILIDLKNGKGDVDDIDHLGNRRIKSVGEMIEDQLLLGLVRIERVAKDRISAVTEFDNLLPQELINAKPISATIKEFFTSSQLSQFMDQNNPLSEITHKRRISALGPGGLTRDRAGFDVRDVHITHYGRLCPIETPEGQNIGLINSMAIYGRPNKYGFIETPYKKVKDGKITDEIVYLSAVEESNNIIAQANTSADQDGTITDSLVASRCNGEFTYSSPSQVQYIDISPKQVLSVASSLIPFLEHDDANRALMGSNMQRQAVPLLKAQAPIVGTGMEKTVARDSGSVVRAKRAGIVEEVDGTRIVIKAEHESEEDQSGVDIYSLVKYLRSNHNTCINQKPIVVKGDKVQAGDVLADGSNTELGELALGQNLTVAFMPWNGYNFEDSILISENVVKEDIFTSVHIEELVCVARDTKLGAEEISNDIPSVSEESLANLDDSGIIYVGAKIKPSDILVGKVTPKGETQLTPEEKLLRAIFGEKASDVKDTSLRVPSGMHGTVIDVQVFTRDGLKKDSRAQSIQDFNIEKYKKDCADELKIQEKNIYSNLLDFLNGKIAVSGCGIKKAEELTLDKLSSLSIDEILTIELKDESAHKYMQATSKKLNEFRQTLVDNIDDYTKKISQGDELNPGVLKIVKVFLAIKRKIKAGDKLAGRHGNKGVVSAIVPVEDMPYMEDGTPVDIVLNPLGVPSRMNIGQVLEVHLGMAAKGLGKKIQSIITEKKNGYESALHDLLGKIYNITGKKVDIDNLNKDTLLKMGQHLVDGVPMATPVFDGVPEDKIFQLLELADYERSGQFTLRDGRTGEPFLRPVTVGVMYMLKLNHLVDDKMHARSTGSYSLVTQQPLGGKAQFGGQRFGEMEVWALEAYGASYTLREMLTVKSDDVQGRTKIYKNIVDGNTINDSGIPESFNVLMHEISALGLKIELIDEN